MCIICVDLDKGKLDPWEASRNRTEMLSQFDEVHLKVLDIKIREHLIRFLSDLKEKNNNDQDQDHKVAT